METETHCQRLIDNAVSTIYRTIYGHHIGGYQGTTTTVHIGYETLQDYEYVKGNIHLVQEKINEDVNQQINVAVNQVDTVGQISRCLQMHVSW